MSRKRVDVAVALLHAENLEGAAKVLRDIDQAFVAKRLKQLVLVRRLTSIQATSLWYAAFPHGSGLVLPEPQSVVVANVSPRIDLRPQISTPPPSRAILLSRPLEFLQWLTSQHGREVRLDEMHVVEPWGLVALAAAARTDDQPLLSVRVSPDTLTGRFAHALGLTDVIEGRSPHGAAEAGRTVKLQRVSRFLEMEKTAADVARLLVQADPDYDEIRRTVQYVLVELLRNVLQHSQDPCGGIVAAQSMYAKGEYGRSPAIQIAVADSGIGIYTALKQMHSDITTPEMALERSLWPYFSGTFDQTKRGASQNAGLGLFFISEMAKLSGGRLLVASRGAALFLEGAADGVNNELRLLPSEYAGTLVVVELPTAGVVDYEAMLRVITERAGERATRRARTRWLRYDIPKRDVFELSVAVGSEDTVAAQRISAEQFVPRLSRKEAIALNFANIDICTQSFIHALLFEALRVAWATRTPIFIRNASPAVRDGLRLLELYSLSDTEEPPD